MDTPIFTVKTIPIEILRRFHREGFRSRGAYPLNTLDKSALDGLETRSFEDLMGRELKALEE